MLLFLSASFLSCFLLSRLNKYQPYCFHGMVNEAVSLVWFIYLRLILQWFCALSFCVDDFLTQDLLVYSRTHYCLHSPCFKCYLFYWETHLPNSALFYHAFFNLLYSLSSLSLSLFYIPSNCHIRCVEIYLVVMETWMTLPIQSLFLHNMLSHTLIVIKTANFHFLKLVQVILAQLLCTQSNQALSN